MRVLIGYDGREAIAWDVAAHSLWQTSRLYAERLDETDLRARGLFTRPVDRRGGRIHDLVSGIDQSTAFALARFLVPIMCRGWVLFTDCDVVFLQSLALLEVITHHPDQADKAVFVVQHVHEPVETSKMDGQAQRAYRRKNWSSVVLWNCDHPANWRLTLNDVNGRHRDDLHAFYWLHDEEIGALPAHWNWLVGVQAPPERIGIAHFTLGGPFTPGWRGAEHDRIWTAARERMEADEVWHELRQKR